MRSLALVALFATSAAVAGVACYCKCPPEQARGAASSAQPAPSVPASAIWTPPSSSARANLPPMDRAGLEKIFRDEPADSNAAAREDELRDRVKKLGGDAGASITALSCKARLCRIEITFESPEALEFKEGPLVGPGAPLTYGSVAGSIFGPEGPGDLRITFFRWHTAPPWIRVTTRQLGPSSNASAAPDAN